MDKTKVEKAVKVAAGLVADVDPSYREQAFGQVFSALLSSGDPDEQPSQGGKALARPTSRPDSTWTQPTEWGKAKLDFSRYARELRKANWEDRCLIVMGVVEEQLRVKALSPAEIGEILTRQLKVQHVYTSNLSRTLGNSLTTFVRVKEGRAYRYSISQVGRDRLAMLTGDDAVPEGGLA